MGPQWQLSSRDGNELDEYTALPVVPKLGFVAGAVVGVGNERWSWCAKDVWWASAAATSGGDTNMEGSSAALASWLAFREAMGSFVAALLRELKMWLYREGLLETGLPVPSGGPHGAMDLAQVEALQRSTLHVTGTTTLATLPGGAPGRAGGSSAGPSAGGTTHMVALSCATGVKMAETQLSLIEAALKAEGAER